MRERRTERKRMVEVVEPLLGITIIIKGFKPRGIETFRSPVRRVEACIMKVPEVFLGQIVDRVSLRAPKGPF